MLIFPELCHGCGACKLFCLEDAFIEVPRELGIVEKGKTNGIRFVHGLLNIGEPFGVPIIRELKELADESKITIFDSPPGTACPAVEAMRDVDFGVLVTEPTPFGLHDLTLTVDVIREIGTPFGVVVNRDGIGDERVEKYCEAENIPLLLKIPNDLEIARFYSRGISIVEGLPEYKAIFAGMYDKIKEMV